MNTKSFYQVVCVKCKSEFTEEETLTKCLKCDEALDVTYDYSYIKGRLNLYALKNSPLSARKYLDFYPINDLGTLVTLNEGGTPLQKTQNLEKQLGLTNLYIKNEGANPTGVFKDRGSLVELSKAKELKIKAVCCASTGNMAASVSAYAAVANIPCYVFVPEGTPIGKLSQTLSYGARVIQVRGTYADCVDLCEKTAKKFGFYLAGDYALRGEGQKSIAYEIVEQLFWRVPDWVIVPMGCGTNIAAIWKGFKEFYQLGLIDKLPKMLGVQPETVPTLVKAFHEKKKRFIKVDKPLSVASAVGIGCPQDDIKALKCLRDSHGNAETASEEEILEAEMLMSRKESMFVEPSAALPVACLKKLLNKGIIKKDDLIVCVATGAGLKDPKSVLSIVPDPPTLEADFGEVENYFKNKLYEIQGVGGKEKNKILWHKIPNKEKVKATIKQEFQINLDSRLINLIAKEAESFIQKGKAITNQDLQNILEESFNQLSESKKVFEIIDYNVQASKNDEAHAKAKIKFNGEAINCQSTGVGTVDALISAMQKGIKGKDHLNMKLEDFNVEIFTGGIDATVKVTIKFKDKNNNQVIAKASSPDLIAASMNAFEKGYNMLYWKARHNPRN